MSFTIAVAGKGGVGKSTLAALIILRLVKNGKGENTKTMQDGSLVIGRFNETSPDLIFAIGIGTTEASRKNALTVIGNNGGVVGVGVTDPKKDLDIQGMIRLKEYAVNPPCNAASEGAIAYVNDVFKLCTSGSPPWVDL